MARKRRDIDDEIERIEQVVAARPARKRGKVSSLPPEILAAIEDGADAEAAAWLADFEQAVTKLVRETDA